MRISDWSSDVCSSDLMVVPRAELRPTLVRLLALLRDKTPTAAVVPIKPGRKSAARKPALEEASPAPEATPQEAAGAATNADEGDAPQDRKSTRLNSSH